MLLTSLLVPMIQILIVVSTVRGDPRAGIGFLNDIRRMNVALTRAKFACYVLGRETTLRSSQPWAAFLDHAYARNCIVHVENPSCNLTTLRPVLRQGTSCNEPNQDLVQHAPKPPLQLFQSAGKPRIFDLGERDQNQGIRYGSKMKKKHNKRGNESRQSQVPNSKLEGNSGEEGEKRGTSAGSRVNTRDPRRFKRSS